MKEVRYFLSYPEAEASQKILMELANDVVAKNLVILCRYAYSATAHPKVAWLIPKISKTGVPQQDAMDGFVDNMMPKSTDSELKTLPEKCELKNKALDPDMPLPGTVDLKNSIRNLEGSEVETEDVVDNIMNLPGVPAAAASSASADKVAAGDESVDKTASADMSGAVGATASADASSASGAPVSAGQNYPSPMPSVCWNNYGCIVLGGNANITIENNYQYPNPYQPTLTDHSNSSSQFTTSSINLHEDVESTVTLKQLSLLTRVTYVIVKITSILLSPLLWPLLLKVIKPNHKGVLYSKNNITLLQPGVHFVLPFVESLVVLNVRHQIDNVQVYTSDLYQLSLSFKYDQQIVNFQRYPFKDAEDHIISLIRACISEETCQNTIKNLVIIEKKVNKMIKQADSVSGVRVSNFVVIRIDVIELLNLNVNDF
ncbi:unnamed protein product [Bursaphelenchus okinawaensis]|uniref:Band 7 domain-containing protein n=1 Tax=Bursaphelenchus okinawaensis TaxID=465554 RepID=A0A811KDD2_9BILA|nr:unnamed protein product [Bursaphelenchus okinawaensis]CAG9098043.1 unnamed protein product [Bursaphelenchus okinawaensis]